MQINGSFPLQFLNNPNPARAPDASQTPGNGAQNNAITPATAVNAAAQAQPETAAATATQTSVVAQARPAADRATSSTTASVAPPVTASRGSATTPRLDLFA